MSAALISSEVKAVQKEHADWSFEQCWDYVESNRPELFSHSSVEGNRVRAKQRPGAELVQAQQQVRIERIARYLMQRNPALTMGQALETTRLALPRVQAEIKEIGRQAERKAHVEAVEEHVEAIEWQPGKRLLIRGSEAFFVD